MACVASEVGTAPSVTSRSGLLDWLRLFAIVEIVAFHIDQSKPWMFFGFGLPFFLITTIAFSVRKPKADSTRSVLRTRVKRLLVPYLFWSVVYLGVLAARCWDNREPFLDALSPWMILGGTAIHLWFLPVAFVGGMAAHLAHKALSARCGATPLMVACLLGLMALIVLGPLLPGLRWPFVQWTFAVPAIFFGYAAGRAMSVAMERRLALLATPILCAVGAALIMWNLEQQVAFSARYALAVVASGLAMVLFVQYDRVVQFLAPMGYGVYLVHPCCIFALHFAERKMGLELAFALKIAIVLALSFSIAWIMLRIKPLRLFV